MLIRMIYDPLLVVKSGDNKTFSSEGTALADLDFEGVSSLKIDMEIREKRAMQMLNINQIANRDLKVTNKESFNKCYPEGDNSSEAFAQVIKRGLTQYVSGNSDNILDHPVFVAEQFAAYLDYFVENRLPLSKGSFCAWLGISSNQFTEYKKSGGTLSGTLEKIQDYIGSFRTKMADQGKIPTIQHIFEMANSHNYTRTDPRDVVKVELTSSLHSSEEINAALGEIIDVELD